MKIDYKKEHNRYRYYFLKTKSFYQKPTVKASFNLLLSFFMVCFFAIFAVRPTLVTIIKLTKELKEKKVVSQSLDEKIESLKQAQTNYAELIEDLVLVDRALPEKVGFDTFASRINFLAFSHNLELTAASFEGFNLVGLESPELSTLNFRISITGSFIEIENFLQDLENIDRIIQIDSLTFASQSVKEGAELQGDLKARVFWLARAPVE